MHTISLSEMHTRHFVTAISKPSSISNHRRDCIKRRNNKTTTKRNVYRVEVARKRRYRVVVTKIAPFSEERSSHKSRFDEEGCRLSRETASSTCRWLKKEHERGRIARIFRFSTQSNHSGLSTARVWLLLRLCVEQLLPFCAKKYPTCHVFLHHRSFVQRRKVFVEIICMVRIYYYRNGGVWKVVKI